jgi:single-strand DNA-binding protein
MEAQISLSGYVGSDVEYKLDKNGSWAYAGFRLGCTPRIKKGDGWGPGPTTWVSVATWNRVAENVRKSIHKGDPVVIMGRLKERKWTVEGQERHQLVVEATSLGHDLAWGASAFVKSQPRSAPPAHQPESFGQQYAQAGSQQYAQAGGQQYAPAGGQQFATPGCPEYGRASGMQGDQPDGQPYEKPFDEPCGGDPPDEDDDPDGGFGAIPPDVPDVDPNPCERELVAA